MTLPQHQDETTNQSIPKLKLPPIPFGARQVNESPVNSADIHLPQGTSINELLDTLKPSSVQSDTPAPHAGFHTAVAERRASIDRRRATRSTSERRKFASPNLAMPNAGPSDPRPQHPPIDKPRLPVPLDTRMLDVPQIEGLQPAVRIELPNRGAVVAQNTLPKQYSGASHPAAKAHAKARPPVHMYQQTQQVHQSRPHPTLNQQAPMVAAPKPAAQIQAPPVPVIQPQAPQQQASQQQAHVDTAMQVWNMPTATSAPNAGTIPIDNRLLNRIEQQPVPTAAAPVAYPAVMPKTSAQKRASASRPAAIIRTLLLVGAPATLGVGLAIGLDRLLF